MEANAEKIDIRATIQEGREKLLALRDQAGFVFAWRSGLALSLTSKTDLKSAIVCGLASGAATVFTKDEHDRMVRNGYLVTKNGNGEIAEFVALSEAVGWALERSEETLNFLASHQ